MDVVGSHHPPPTNLNQFQLYIMTLGCLAPYRRLGIGTKMLEHVLNVVKEDGNFTSIFLHVQINNESAIEFYKKFGFNIVETKEQYYKVRWTFPEKKFLTLNYLQRIEPADAHVLEKYLKPEELNSKLSNGFEDVGDREN